jgi:hypothetical protein
MTSPTPADGTEHTTPQEPLPPSADEALPPGADEPLPPTAQRPVTIGLAASGATPSAARAAAGCAPGGEGPAGGNAFAAGFARQHFFSGARFLKPGRRAVVATAGVVGIAAIAVGVTAGVSHLGGGDEASVQSAASTKPLATGSGTATGGSKATTFGPAATTPRHHTSKPPTAPPVGKPGKSGSTGGTGNSTTGGSAGTGTMGTTTSTTQAAKPPATAYPMTFTGGLIVNFASNRCLASQGGSRSAGTQMVLADCDRNDPSQGWTFPSDGTARDFGGTMCLDVSSPGNGALLRLAACSAGRATEQAFVLKSSYDLVDVHPDLCVDAKDNGTAAGTVLQTWSCAGTSNQKWRMP